MLILTRKKNESIIIDDNIKITVVDIDNNRIQLGIDAPRSISIHREEIYKEIQEENRIAAASNVNISEIVENLKRIQKKENNNSG